jgi:hypothetical protein
MTSSTVRSSRWCRPSCHSLRPLVGGALRLLRLVDDGMIRGCNFGADGVDHGFTRFVTFATTRAAVSPKVCQASPASR